MFLSLKIEMKFATFEGKSKLDQLKNHTNKTFSE